MAVSPSIVVEIICSGSFVIGLAQLNQTSCFLTSGIPRQQLFVGVDAKDSDSYH
jgi:hypothetical protein